MSYILDALRKSEQQRLQGEAPLLVSTQLSSNVEKQPTYLLYGLVASTLICAGILIGWWRPWQHDETKPVKDSITLKQYDAKLAQIAPKPQPLPPEPEKTTKPELELPVQKSTSTIKPASVADSTEQALPAPVSVPPKVAAQPPRMQTSTALPKVLGQRVEEAAKPAIEKAIPPSPESNVANGTNDSSETAPEQKIIAMTALPLAIQQEIPTMSISGHAYSSVAKERIVGINDRLLQEGEYLTPGLRLEQITEDGLVFSYKKYLFRHSL